MRRRGGFSLIELLVAIAIIGVLSAILFPVFISARERAKRTFCVNNLRQVHVALSLYADDYNGYMPRFKDLSSKKDGSRQSEGPALLQTYVRNKNVFFCPNARNLNAKSLGERPYELVLPEGGSWQCSYHMLCDDYGSRAQNYYQTGQSWMPGRMDCNVADRNIKLLEACGYDEARYKKAVAYGGPLVDNYLHIYGDKGVDQMGVLFVNLRGTVQFVPNSQYPFWNLKK